MRRRRRSRRRQQRSWTLRILATILLLGFAISCLRALGSRSTPSAPSPQTDPAKPSVTGAKEGGKSSPPPPAAESPYCLYGCPFSELTKGRLLSRREGWVLSNNPETKFADWVSYRVTPGTIGKSKERVWQADPDLPPESTLEPEDFRGAHAALETDRGHQVPLASFSGTKNWQPLNYMSNITPQRSLLNQRLWNFLEQAERRLVQRENTQLYVVTGPLYEREMAPMPGADESHRVPSGYFKVLARRLRGTLSTAALIVDQDTPSESSYCDHEVTIDEVEARSGFDLFSLLPDGQEGALEQSLGTLFSQLGCP